MSLKLHPSYITDIQSLGLDGESLSDLWIKSNVPMYSDSECKLPVDNPCSMEVINIADIRFLDRPTIIIMDKNGNELYVDEAMAIDEYFGAPTPASLGIKWGDVLDKPTSFNPATHNHSWANITSGKPTTLAGYGITDAFTQTLADARYPQLSIQYTNPSWLAGIDASIISTGTIDPARLPVIPTQAPIVSTGDLTALTTTQQNQIVSGTIVTTTDGNRYVYNTGTKTLVSSYIQLADVTPDWSVIGNRPINVSYWANDAGYATPNSIMTWTNQHSFNAQVTFNDYVLLKGHNIVTYLWSNNAFSDIRLRGQGFIRLNAETMTDAVANYSDAFSAGYNGKDRWRVYADGHMDWYGGATIAGPLITSITPSTTYGMVIGSALKVDGKITANGVNVSDTLVSLVNNQANFQPKLPSGSSLDYIDGTGNIQTFPTKMTPYAHTHAWADITSGKPTTLAGYGITDAIGSSDSRLTNARTPTAHNQAWSTITGTPTTLSGYGITDAVGSSDSRLSDTRIPTNQSWYVIGDNASCTRSGSGTNSQNTLRKSGFYSYQAWADSPVANTWTHLIHSQYHNDAGSTNTWSFDIAANFGSAAYPGSAENYYMRCIASGTSTGWRKLWHDGNFDANRVTNLETRMTGVDNNWSNYLAKSGGTMSGALNFANNTWNTVGDDVQIGDINLANTLGLRGAQNNAIGYIKYGTGPSVGWNGSVFNIPSVLVASQNSLFAVADYLGNTALNEWVWFGYNGIQTSSSRYAGFMASKDGDVIASARYNQFGYLNAENSSNVTHSIASWNIDRFHVYKNLTVAGSLTVGGSLYLGQASMGSWVSAPTTHGWFGHAVRNQNDWSGLLANNTGSVWLGCLANQTVKLNYGGADRMILDITGFDFRAGMKVLDTIVSYKGASDSLGSASRIGVTNSTLAQGWLFGYGAGKDLQLWESATDNSWTMRYRFTGLQMKLPIYAVVGSTGVTIAQPLYDGEVRLYRGATGQGTCYLKCRATTEIVKYRTDAGARATMSTAAANVPLDISGQTVMLMWAMNGASDGQWTMVC